MPKSKQPSGAPDDGKKSQGGKKKNTSLRLDAKTLKALKHRAIEQDTSVQKIIETLVDDYLESGKS